MFRHVKTYYVIFILLIYSMTARSQNQSQQADWSNLNRYAAANKLIKAPAKGEKRVVFMGNSITESWKTFDSGFFQNKPYVNRGISGQVTAQMLARFRQDVIDLKPKVVVILAGINDIAQNMGPIAIEDIFKNIAAMAALAKSNKVIPVLSSVLPAFDFPWRRGLQPAEKVRKLNTLIENYCRKEKLIYADYYSHMVDDRMGLDQRYTYDGVHPNLAGYKVMEPIVEAAIKKAR